MDAHPRADDLHGFPLEKRTPEADARNAYWPLTMDTPTLVTTFTAPTGVILARQDSSTTTTTGNAGTSTCAPDNNSGICEKPASASKVSLPIALGVAIPVVGVIIALLVLHRRHVRRQREEDANDRHASLDFGLGEGRQSKWKKQKNGVQQASSDFNLEEKSGHRGKGMSLDINSPYILPPGLNNSHDSLHSLSRSITNNEDPYRPVTALGDGGSIRSFGGRKHDASSIYTSHSGTSARFQENPVAGLVGNASQMGRTPAPAFVPPPRQGSLPQYPSNASSPIEPNDSARDISPIEPAYFPNRTSSEKGVPQKGLPSNPKDGFLLFPDSAQEPRDSYVGQDTTAMRMSNNYLGAYISGGAHSQTPPPSALSKDIQSSPFSDSAAVVQMPKEPNFPEEDHIARKSPPIANSLPANPRPQRQASLPPNQPMGSLPEIPQVSQPHTSVEDDYDNNNGFFVTPPSPTTRNAEIKQSNRYSMDVPPEEYANAGLGAPGVDPRRISMGFRPLPPALAVESDDPEIRANRIRSFYKEYFDDSKPAPQGQYYEDYEDGAYYDPQANNFVMPYAQPVTRRAMTPPPGAGRFMGQQPPRTFHGSLAQNNYGPPRNPRAFNGSVSSSQYQGPPGFGEPRPFSSASNRRGPPPGRGRPGPPAPPPQDLSTIPTPALLKDDSFAILNAIDFAPPTSYKERAQGRSQSPMGERKAYQMNVAAHQPLVSAFDELAVIPSPHMLRKSGTFTSLDFAPPRKVFRDNDTMSDAGSIRSNRSGISTVQLQAIRSGAHRVSRLPADQVFSKDDMSSVLKPSWGLRQG